LLVVLRRLVEMRAQAVDAGRPRRVALLVLSLGYTLGYLLRRSLALWNALLALGGLVSLRAVVVYCQRLSVSRTHTSIGCTTANLPDGFGDDWPEEASTDWCERFDFLENIEGIAGTLAAWSSSWDAAGWRWRGGDNDGLS
jgi:hypothetical protein